MMRQPPPAPAPVRIVSYHEAHRADFERLNLEWIERYFWLEERDRAVLGDPWGQIIARGGEIFFVLEGTDAVGTVAMVPMGEGEYELTKMAVTPAAQGRGYGRRLAQRALDWARERGARRVSLHSQTSLSAAIALYRRLGFITTHLGPSPGYARSDIQMAIDLAQENPS